MVSLFSNTWQISNIFYIKLLEKSDGRKGTYSHPVFPYLFLNIPVFTRL